MNFFEAQDRARRNTAFLVLLFTLALAGIVAGCYALAHFLLVLPKSPPGAGALEAVDYELLLHIALAVLAFVSAVSLGKIFILSRGGGEAVAAGMGGRLLHPSTRDAAEKQLLNIVEETALAAGTVPPPVYLLPEEGINAFAAGANPGDAVIGITQGALRRLSRDEMQGVVAHEFSHIMNGDMRINLRLIAIIHGIMLIGYIGYFALRSSMYSRGRNNPLPLIGLGLVVVGFVGTFFGNWIRAAVSRQREFLADAAAVQYTRNPQGIGGALEKIGIAGGLLGGANAAECAHMFFAGGIKSAFAAMFATHPPIDERIRRVIPNWTPQKTADGYSAAQTSATAQPSAMSSGFAGASSPLSSPLSSAHGGENIGGAEANIADAFENSYSARAMIYALLLDDDNHLREKQLEWVRRFADEGVYEITLRYFSFAAQSRARAAEIARRAAPALRSLSPRQYRAFAKNMEALIVADSAVSLHEWAVVAVIEHALAPHFGDEKRSGESPRGEAAAAYPLSLLARAGGGGKTVFDSAAKRFGGRIRYDESAFTPQKLFAHLRATAKTGTENKRRFMQAAEECARSDGKICDDEYLLLSAFAAMLESPIPPRR